MKPSFSAFLAATVCLCLTQCIVVDGEAAPGSATQLPDSLPAGSAGPLTASATPGAVVIRQGGRVINTIRPAMPVVEETRWQDGQNQIVVKSRGNHGPATVQLFDSRSGAQLGTVMAYELANGGPAWAAGMGD